MSWLIGFFAKSALMQSPIGAFLKMIPARAWKIIGALALVLALFWAHQHIVHKALKKADVAGYQRARAEDAAALAKAHRDALAWKSRFDQSMVERSQKFREKTDAEIARIDRHAADIMRNGPGKASCGQVDYPGVPAGAGGYEAPAQPGSTAVDRLPDQGRAGLIALPFSSTIAVARQCDADRAEVISWRQWYDQVLSVWPH